MGRLERGAPTSQNAQKNHHTTPGNDTTVGVLALPSQVEAEWRWRQLAEALTGMASVNRDASMRLRG